MQDNIDFLAHLTKNLLKNGLDYRVTLTGKTKVEILDVMTSKVIGQATEETLEEALSVVLSQLAGRFSNNKPVGLSIL